MPLRSIKRTGGVVFHVMNRGVRRLRLFDQTGDYRCWIRSFRQAHLRVPVKIFAYCIMPNHFHLVVRPSKDGDLAEFMRLGTCTHGKRWHEDHGSVGTGAVYQARYRAFPVQTEAYFWNVCRYVEANPLRAGLVSRAEDWTWSSGAAGVKKSDTLEVSEWPILKPPHWTDVINQCEPPEELDRMRTCAKRNIPLGDDAWAARVAFDLGLGSLSRRPGRPRRTSA